MTDSILVSTKKNVGLAEDYQAFDSDIIMYINSALSSLSQLGVGPEGGYQITGAEETWESLLGGDPRLNNVKTYVTLKVKMLFDPPTTGYLMTAMEKNLQEHEFRINVQREAVIWRSPEIVDDEDVVLILDGGTP